MSNLVIKNGRLKPIINHHPWIFSGAIAHIDSQAKAGDVVQVVDPNGRFLAQAYYNPKSQIQGRILSWDDVPIKSNFWREKIERAYQHRQKLELEPDTNTYRLINAEADGLPGLIVDKYGDYIVMQCLTLGIDQRKEMLVELLVELLQPKAIIERSDVPVRKKEGLSQTKGVLWGDAPPEELVVQENGRLFGVNLLKGHKTGLYLDQRENRTAVCSPTYVQNKTILNTFAYTGGFAIYAAANNAQKIINIDSSIPVLEQAERNIALNNFERPQDEYIAGDAFEILRHYRDEGESFDVVILDPPKFINSKRDIQSASRGYKDLNLQALKLIRPGGLLATFSCSGLMSADLFQKIVFGAAVDAGRDVQIMHHLHQAADHPTLLTFPESAYLKGFLCRVW